MNSKVVIHKAKWMVITSDNIIMDGFIKVESNIIREVGKGKIKGADKVIDHGEGILIPAFVNAHTHLELSALKNKIEYSIGFENWVKEVLRLRDSFSEKQLLSAASKALDKLIQSNCIAIGEVSTLGITKQLFIESKILGVWFQEYLGSNQIQFDLHKSYDFNMVSFAGHAPHTTSPTFLIALKNKAKIKKQIFSVHISESYEELEFITTGKGSWADFLKMRSIDFSNWPIPSKSPIQYLDNLGILDQTTLGVHLIFTSTKDIELIKKRGVKICFCPRSNINIHKKLPELEKILNYGIKPCLGTDSLASVDSLDIVDEMAFVFKNFPLISPKEIFNMATLNGAKALGLQNKIGTLEPDKISKFGYIQNNVSSLNNVLETVIMNYEL